MDTLNLLKPIIGEEKTLVITCLECCYDLEQNGHGQVFRYTTLGNMINPRDTHEQDNLRGFVDFKKCTRIIVAGHHDCKALQYIRCDLKSDSPIANLQDNLRTLYGNNHASMLMSPLKETLVIELNVIEQCKCLLSYGFIRERFERGELSIVGIILKADGDVKTIFKNGIGYNDPISLN
jgi:carbonic anhydrase